MLNTVCNLLAVFGLVLATSTPAPAETYSIPTEKVNTQKVYWGSAASFQKPGRVDYEQIVKSTPEYSSIKKKKIQSGTAKYWILLSKASDHAVRLISEVGQETDFDLIVASGYFEEIKLEKPAETPDITSLVLAKLEHEGGA